MSKTEYKPGEGSIMEILKNQKKKNPRTNHPFSRPFGVTETDKFVFVEEWLDSEKNFISIKCTTDSAFYSILIHTYDDPYICYYQEGVCPDKDLKKELETELFIYLHSKYPDHWD